MANKRNHLPREGHAGPEELGPGEKFIDQTDVEGHSWVNPAPPVDFSKGTPSSGGELTPTEATEQPGPNGWRITE